MADVIPKPRPVPTATSQPFWDALRDERIDLQHCDECGTWVYYPRARCPHCLSARLTWRTVERRRHGVHVHGGAATDGAAVRRRGAAAPRDGGADRRRAGVHDAGRRRARRDRHRHARTTGVRPWRRRDHAPALPSRRLRVKGNDHGIPRRTGRTRRQGRADRGRRWRPRQCHRLRLRARGHAPDPVRQEPGTPRRDRGDDRGDRRGAAHRVDRRARRRRAHPGVRGRHRALRPARHAGERRRRHVQGRLPRNERAGGTPSSGPTSGGSC